MGMTCLCPSRICLDAKVEIYYDKDNNDEVTEKGVDPLVFTGEEFQIMVDELLYQEPVSFDMLCHIAQKTLENKVRYWCYNDATLKNRGCEDDIMQEIHLRLIKTTVSGFLLREGVSGVYNNDPEGFEDWMFQVAKNIKKDFANRIRGRDIKTESLDELESQWLSERQQEELERRIERLGKAFDIVMAADAGVYKVLSWLAQFLFILDRNITKIESADEIIAAFEHTTLNEMYAKLRTVAKRIPWVQITQSQDERLRKALDMPWDGTYTYGQMEFCVFFMKHNAQVAGKKSISDWSNRMNNLIRRELKKQNAQAYTQEKRRQADEPSDN